MEVVGGGGERLGDADFFHRRRGCRAALEVALAGLHQLSSMGILTKSSKEMFDEC